MFLPQLQSIKQSPMKLGKIFIENVSSFDIRGEPILKLLP